MAIAEQAAVRLQMRCEVKRICFIQHTARFLSLSFPFLSLSFLLQGPEVVIAPAVLAERELLQREAQDLNPAVSNPDADVDVDVDQDEETVGEEKAEGALAEEKEANRGDDTMEKQSEYLLGRQKEITPEMMVPSMKMLQRAASSLLRFLVAVSMRQASLARSIDSARSEEVRVQGSRDKVPSTPGDSRPMGRGQERSTPKADVGTAVAVLPPTRERSMYGTPLKQMQTHVDILHQVICPPQLADMYRFQVRVRLSRSRFIYIDRVSYDGNLRGRHERSTVRPNGCAIKS